MCRYFITPGRKWISQLHYIWQGWSMQLDFTFKTYQLFLYPSRSKALNNNVCKTTFMAKLYVGSNAILNCERAKTISASLWDFSSTEIVFEITLQFWSTTHNPLYQLAGTLLYTPVIGVWNKGIAQSWKLVKNAPHIKLPKCLKSWWYISSMSTKRHDWSCLV